MTTDRSLVVGVKDLRDQWFGMKPLAEAVEASFDRIGFTAEYVKSSIASTNHRSRRFKAIKDSVWGMMEFGPAAVRLIDSPLLQRLRRIKQLGFSYLTYPSAEHSRFIHSVGMAHVVTRFVDAINREHRDLPDLGAGIRRVNLGQLSGLHENDLIHAALLHDIGHLPFSHATESAIEANRDVFRYGGLQAYGAFKGPIGGILKKNVSLSEALSILFVLSPRFEEYYNGCILGPDEPEDAIYRIACLIAGVPPCENAPNIHSIISASAVDADKIDYVARDAAACGIPIGVDDSRVYLGSSLLSLNAAAAKRVLGRDQESYLFALNASGLDTFDEVIRSRATLYQRVYLHGVTRTAEALLSRALQLSASAGKPDAVLRDVLSLWAEHDDAVLDRLAASSLAEVRDLGVALRDRQLPKKGSALARAIVSTQAPFDEILPKLIGVEGASKVRGAVVRGFEQGLTRKKSTVKSTLELENEIVAEARCLREMLGSKVEKLPDDPTTLRSVVVIPIASLDNTSSNAPIFQHGEIVYADELTNARGVVDASDMFRAIGYVMCPPTWREIVLTAVRTVLYRRSLELPTDDLPLGAARGKVLPEDLDGTLGDPADEEEANPIATEEPSPAQDAERIVVRVRPLALVDAQATGRRVGADPKRLDAITHQAERVGYFNDYPLLAARSEPGDFAEHAAIFGQFDGEGGWKVTPKSVAAFIDQAPPSLRGKLAAALKKGKYLDQSTVTDSLNKTIRALHADLGGRVLVTPLSPSSGGINTSFVKSSAASTEIIFCNDIHEVLRTATENDIVVFVDDNAASGVQASAQLWAYAGKPRAEWPDDLRDETGVFGTPLAPEHLQRLQQIGFSIAVAAGHERATERLSRNAKVLDIPFHGVRYETPIGGQKWDAELQAWLTSVGRDLIAWDRFQTRYDGLSDDKRDLCDYLAFGYGNLGGLTITPFNVPASTVTAFWMPGQVADRPWVPLFIRRGRLRKLIVC